MSQAPSLKSYLDSLVEQIEQPSFIPSDPVVIPHGFDDPRDQEVIGLYAALLAWGQRTTILKKLEELCERMRYRPYDFVLRFQISDVDRLAGFKHRTFQPEDAYWFTRCLSTVLKRHETLENVFSQFLTRESPHVGPAIEGFSMTLLNAMPDVPARLSKHIARPGSGSACKRLNMYLRWMVRSGPVDLGIWRRIAPSQLLLPLDVHSGRTARALGLLKRLNNDWTAALELTDACRKLCPEDPARYDYAFFGSGVAGLSLDTRFVVDGNTGRTTSPRPR